MGWEVRVSVKADSSPVWVFLAKACLLVELLLHRDQMDLLVLLNILKILFITSLLKTTKTMSFPLT